MRVLVYRMNSGFNGVTTWMADLGRALKGRGVDVSFWFAGGAEERAEPFRALGPTRMGPVSQLLATLQREKYDVVHVATGDRFSLALTLLHRNYRLVATNHGSVSRIYDSTNAHALTAVSHDMVALEQPYTDLAVDMIYTGVDTSRFTLPAGVDGGRPIIAWAGRANDLNQKDFARFTRVASRLQKKGFRIWVADGSGSSPSDFTGEGYDAVGYDAWKRLTMDQIPEFYRAVAASGGVMLMTSRYEAFGLVAIEAAAAGAPTIGTTVLGLREAIMPEYGAQYAASATDDEVATLVEEYVAANPPSVGAYRRRAEAVGARFSIAEMTDRYLSVYQRSSPLVLPARPELPEPLPSGAAEWLKAAATPTMRHRGLWPPIVRELAASGERGLAMRAARTLVRNDPALLLRPRELAQLGAAVLRGRSKGSE